MRLCVCVDGIGKAGSVKKVACLNLVAVSWNICYTCNGLPTALALRQPQAVTPVALVIKFGKNPHRAMAHKPGHIHSSHKLDSAGMHRGPPIKATTLAALLLKWPHGQA